MGVCQQVSAQKDNEIEKSPAHKIELRHEIGVAAGGIVGLGPAYRIWANKLGGQVCFTPISTGKTEIYSAAISFMYSLRKTESTNFFVYQGNHFISYTEYFSGTYSYVYKQDPNGLVSYRVDYTPARTDKQRFLNNGLGLGLDYFNVDRNVSPFGFNIQCGIAGFKNFTRAFFTGELAILYKFK
jgi:hypothetical protein